MGEMQEAPGFKPAILWGLINANPEQNYVTVVFLFLFFFQNQAIIVSIKKGQ